MKMEIAEDRDFGNILELQKKAYQSEALIYDDFNLPPLTQTLDELMDESKGEVIYKYEIDGNIAASVRCRVMENDVLYIGRLIVDPAFQNKGIATGMLKRIEDLYADTVKSYTLFTGHLSEKNLHLYKKLGYRETRREPLTDRCTLVHMEKAGRSAKKNT
jgi:ribosomal protein S18 acetylase RimI-like enzyme